MSGRKVLSAVVAPAVVACAISGHAWGGTTLHATGGGVAAVGAPFSQFGFGVDVSPTGEVNGHFNCLMAGQTAFAAFEPLMAVRGQVTAAVITPETGLAQFSGTGQLNLGPTGRMPAQFSVEILQEGGAGVGKFHLTVIAPPFPMPIETVLHGTITIH